MSRIDSLAPYARAVSVGAAAGLRSLTPPAFVFRGKTWMSALKALAASELIADKFPQVPSRLYAPALIARALSGAACGGEVAARANGSRTGGMVAGAAAAIAASYTGHALRAHLTEKRKWHAFAVAALEDAVTLSLVRYASGGAGA